MIQTYVDFKQLQLSMPKPPEEAAIWRHAIVNFILNARFLGADSSHR